MSKIINQLNILRDSYEASLEKKLSVIADVVQKVLDTQSTEEALAALATLQDLTHKLAGSAGTYGFSQIGQAANKLEILCITPQLKNKENYYQSLQEQLQILLCANKIFEQNSSISHAVASILQQKETPKNIPIHNILLVEDDSSQAHLLSTLLTNFSFNITCLSDLSSLKKTINATSPDLILMDIIFAGKPNAGLNAIKALKDKNELLCPVIFLSVRNDFEARLEATRAGGQGYVVKPVKILDLINSIDLLTKAKSRSPYRALIIDDDIDLTQYYKLTLKKAGIQSKIINDPMLAMAAIESYKPDTILLDINMPHCNGVELAKTIRQKDEHYLQIPIIFITAAQSEKTHLDAILGGGDDIINKPVDTGFLVSSLITRSERARTISRIFSKQKSSETRFKLLSQSAKDPIFSINSKGLVNFWNQAASFTFGYEECEILGQKASLIFSKYDAKELYKAIEEFKTGKTCSFFENTHEIIAEKKGGITFSAEFSFSYYTPSNSPCIIAIARDISKQKAFEQELKKAKETAEMLNQSKSTFLSHMSHELRTPLNAILGFSHILKSSSELTPSSIDKARKINNAGKHLLNLIDETLDLSKIEAGKLNISMGRVDLNALITECFSLIQPLAEKTGIKLHYSNNQEQDYFIKSDYTRIKQILLNLLSNAVKYNKEGGSVKLYCQEIQSTRIKIFISDTGKGLSEHQIKNLFHPFERLGAENSSIEGTGIGLVITKQLVTLMGGGIGCTSRVGEGSVFWIELNLTEAISTPLPITVSANNKTAPETTNLIEKPTKTILYIEDDLINIQLMEHFIATRTSYCLQIANDPLKGIQQAITEVPDLVLLDIFLPKMDGYEVLKQLRSISETKDIPVIGVSANAMKEDIEKAKVAGFDDYLTKPLDFPCLINLLNEKLTN